MGPNRYTATASDPESEAWTTILSHPSDCVYNMKQLTRLELPVHMGDMAGLQHLQQCLPAGLQELQLGADAGSEQDEGAIAFGVIEGEEVLQGRQQYPLELSHLTALTKLTLSASVPLVSDDELPATLLQLRLRQCFDLHPLLGLTKLQSLALRPSTIPPRRLQDLTQLTSLTSVKLFYEGGYQQCGEFTHWSIQRLNESAAVWIQLPVVSLGLYEGSGPYEGGVFGPLTVGLTKQMQKLAGLTSLTLDWPLEHAVFAGIGQLTHLRQLSLHWGWYDEYVGTRWTEHTAEQLANCADAVLHVMHGFAALPHLQELCWLCDEDRDLCLSLEGLQQSLEQLGPRGAPGSMQVSFHELAALVEPNMEEYEY
ncbi:hypothetical protein OEZ85_005746 [Tetradesmus obliquus]|uniref:Uncharacterized protein n=1 Tax=Tetradesmus obliquus TaxID=3088 RepID=A0ABY8UEB5_TETOB|nr:hypothetical protein OEZ85_005746 [Tetradesmus obliquus]